VGVVVKKRDGLSIVIPFHQAYSLLERTVQAVIHDCRQQLDMPWEVILVGNESPPSVVANLWALCARLGTHEAVRILNRRNLRVGPFQPGAARNVGIATAGFTRLVFLDADCIPSSTLVQTLAENIGRDPGAVMLGHRVFVDPARLPAACVARDRSLLDAIPTVPSTSNYGQVLDRRLPELQSIDAQAHPYNCLFGSNFGVHVDCLGAERFDPVFDGHWGYEDIDLGFRLHRAGRRFRYLPDAFVYHQEGLQLGLLAREQGRRRNFRLAAQRIPGFLEMRMRSTRAGAVPDDVRADGCM
jgi:hypothetical protein